MRLLNGYIQEEGGQIETRDRDGPVRLLKWLYTRGRESDRDKRQRWSSETTQWLYTRESESDRDKRQRWSNETTLN